MSSSQPPGPPSTQPPGEQPSDLPPIAPPGATPPGAGASAAPGTTAAAQPEQPPRPAGWARRILLALIAVVVLVAVAVGAFLFFTRGDGTKRTATPLEVRRLVATFPCTPDRPGTPEDLRLTAGQEVVRIPRAGCAVVGEVVGSVDRLEKVENSRGTPECTVTVDAPAEYGRIVDAASNVSDGQTRALVAGGWLLDVRAVIDYPGRPSDPLHVVFTAPDIAACDAVAGALALS
jgi:hypothetical protein